MSRAITAVAAVLVLAGMVACGSARRGEPLTGALRLDEQEARGKLVFDRFCHSCHPGGEAGVGPAINNKPLPGFMIRFQVRHGVGAMPGFPEQAISDDELEAVISYLTALRRAKPTVR